MPKIYKIDSQETVNRFGVSQQNLLWLASRNFANRYDPASGVTGRPDFIVLHIQDGNTPGSLGHWLCCAEASSHYMVQKDGSILSLVPEQHGAWTNGDVKSPTQQSAEIRGRGGNPNIWSVTIEAEGTPWEKMSDVQLQSIVWLVKDIQKRRGIPTSRVIPHSSINHIDRTNCPGPYYARVISMLTDDGLGSPELPTPTTAKPRIKLPPFDGRDKTIEGRKMYAAQRYATLKNDSTPRQYADRESFAAGEQAKAGTELRISYIRVGVGNEQFYCDADGRFFPISDFAQRLKVENP